MPTLPPQSPGLRSPSPDAARPAQASPWVMRFAPLLRAHAQVLDLACGRGRHARALSALGHRVLAVDRDDCALRELHGLPGVEVLAADLEAAPWPLDERRFDAVVVTNYLWRPLLPRIVHAVDSRGVLLYETFALAQQAIGRPRNPQFLLRPGELLDAVRPDLRVVAYEDGFVASPHPAFVQRICAVREPDAGAGDSHPPKYNL